MMMRFVALLFLVSISSLVYAQWDVVHPGTSIYRYLSKAYVNGNKFLVAGNVMGVSIDDGNTWQVIEHSHLPHEISAVTHYHDLIFTTESKGYFLFQNRIYKTTDGGSHWNKVLELTQTHPQYQASAFLQSIYFLDELHGYAVGEFERLLETTDGGETWKPLIQSTQISPYRSFSDVFFINESIGFISGYEVSNITMNFGFREFVMRTTDGGKQWEEIEVEGTLENRILRLQFIDDQYGFVHLTRSQFGDALFTTRDGGSSWTQIQHDELRDIRAVYWINKETGLIFGRDFQYESKLMRTVDGGANWDVVPVPLFSGQDEYAIQSFAFINSTTGIAVGSGGNILKTTDGGKTWQRTNTGYPNFYAFDFVNGQEGYASSGRGLFKTINGGVSWQYADKSDSVLLLDITFNAAHQGILSGFKNNYHRVLANGGVIEKMNLPVVFMSMSEAVMAGDSLFVAGRTLAPTGNAFLKSGDWGETWTTTYLPDTQNFPNALNKIDDTFYVSTTHTILKSAGGKQWSIVSDFSPARIETMLFVNETTGLVLSDHKLMKTVDGGESWHTMLTLDDNFFLNGFLRATESIVFAYGYKLMAGNNRGTIWKSVDGGATWNEEVLPVLVGEGITDMCIAGEYVMATGGFGQVLRSPVRSVMHSEEQPDKQLLLFPIPAVDQLSFKISDDRINRIVLYDVTGRQSELMYLQRDGVVMIDVDHLPGGLYILRAEGERSIYKARFIKQQ